MTATVLVLLPHGTLADGANLCAGCRVVEWHTPDDIVRELGALAEGIAGVVLMSDRIEGDAFARVVAAVEGAGVPVVEVQGRHWDGFSTSPLAAVSKGVISGFGIHGVRAAAEALGSL